MAEGVSGWGHHGECGPPYNGGLGQSPQRGPGAEHLVRGSGGAKPPEAESILVIECPTEPANLAPFQKCICISTLGATVMIWKNLCRNPGGSGPLRLPGGAHGGKQFLLALSTQFGDIRQMALAYSKRSSACGLHGRQAWS